MIAGNAYVSSQAAVAFLQTFNQPVSHGSEWETLALRNEPIPWLPSTWQVPLP
jgi:hypothetical protein